MVAAAAADPDVLALRDGPRLVQRRLDPLSDEIENGAALHLLWWPRMVGQNEHRRVVRRIRAPPPLPFVVRPCPAHGPEHVAAHDPRANVLERASREFVVDAGRPAVAALDIPQECAGADEPLVQLLTAPAQRLFAILIGAGAEAVGGDRESVHAKLGHGRFIFFARLRRLNCFRVLQSPRASAAFFSPLQRFSCRSRRTPSSADSTCSW